MTIIAEGEPIKIKAADVLLFILGMIPYIAIALLILSFDSGRSSITGDTMTLWERGYNLFNGTPLAVILEMIGGGFAWYVFCKVVKYTFIIVG